MNVTLAPGASLRRVAEIVRNAVLFGPCAWEGGGVPDKSADPARRQNILPTDSDVVELFSVLGARRIPYLLVGDIAMLRYVEGGILKISISSCPCPQLANCRNFPPKSRTSSSFVAASGASGWTC